MAPRKRVRDHTDLQRRLLLCPLCERLSETVMFGARPGTGKLRTDFVIVGACQDDEGAVLMHLVRDEGYRDVQSVPWSGLGRLLRDLDEAGLLERVAS